MIRDIGGVETHLIYRGSFNSPYIYRELWGEPLDRISPKSSPSWGGGGLHGTVGFSLTHTMAELRISGCKAQGGCPTCPPPATISLLIVPVSTPLLLVSLAFLSVPSTLQDHFFVGWGLWLGTWQHPGIISELNAHYHVRWGDCCKRATLHSRLLLHFVSCVSPKKKVPISSYFCKFLVK